MDQVMRMRSCRLAKKLNWMPHFRVGCLTIIMKCRLPVAPKHRLNSSVLERQYMLYHLCFTANCHSVTASHNVNLWCAFEGCNVNQVTSW